MSTQLARSAMIRAKTSENMPEKINALIKAIEELSKAVEQLEARLTDGSRHSSQ